MYFRVTADELLVLIPKMNGRIQNIFSKIANREQVDAKSTLLIVEITIKSSSINVKPDPA